MIIYKDLFNIDTLTLRQRFGLHYAVDLLFNTLSAVRLSTYKSINKKAAATVMKG
jgi:hypothetical protein